MTGSGRTTVQKHHRAPIPLSVIAAVNWLREQKADEINCFSTFGARGGLQVFPSSGSLEQYCQDLRKAVGIPPSDDESDAKWVELLRLDSVSWPVQIHRNGESFRLVIPEKAVEFGILNRDAGTQLVAFGSGDILELWDFDKWGEHAQGIAKSRTEIRKEVETDLKIRRESLAKD